MKQVLAVILFCVLASVAALLYFKSGWIYIVPDTSVDMSSVLQEEKTKIIAKFTKRVTEINKLKNTYISMANSIPTIDKRSDFLNQFLPQITEELEYAKEVMHKELQEIEKQIRAKWKVTEFKNQLEKKMLDNAGNFPVIQAPFIIKKIVQHHVKDPDSLKLLINPVAKLQPTGWKIQGCLKSKNGFGGYGNWIEYSILFRQEQVVEFVTSDNKNSYVCLDMKEFL